MALRRARSAYGEAQARIRALSETYRAKGYGAGHRVGILMENRPGFFLHWFALNALGVSLVPINPDMRAAELEYLIGHSEIVAAVVIPSRRDDVVAAAKAIGRDIPVVGPDDEPATIAAPAPQAGHARSRQRMRPALHLRHHRPAERLRAAERIFSLCRAIGTPRSAA